MISKLFGGFKKVNNARGQAYQIGIGYASLLNTIGFRKYHVRQTSRSPSMIEKTQREEQHVLDSITQAYRDFNFIERLSFRQAIKNGLERQAEAYRSCTPSYDSISTILNRF